MEKNSTSLGEIQLDTPNSTRNSSVKVSATTQTSSRGTHVTHNAVQKKSPPPTCKIVTARDKRAFRRSYFTSLNDSSDSSDSDYSTDVDNESTSSSNSGGDGMRDESEGRLEDLFSLIATILTLVHAMIQTL